MLHKKIIHTFFISVLFLGLSINLCAQERESQKTETTKLLVKSYFRLPNVTTNDFYREVSRGISDIGISLNYEIYKGFNLGVGFKHSFFEISQFKISENIDSKTHFFGPYAELSYMKYVSPTWVMDISVQAGNQQMFSSSNPCRAEGLDFTKETRNFIAPNMAFSLRAGERMGYSFSFGYTFTNSSFSARSVCLDTFKDHEPADFIGPIQHVNIGFGVIIYLGKLKLIQ